MICSLKNLLFPTHSHDMVSYAEEVLMLAIYLQITKHEKTFNTPASSTRPYGVLISDNNKTSFFKCKTDSFSEPYYFLDEELFARCICLRLALLFEIKAAYFFINLPKNKNIHLCALCLDKV